MIKIKKKGFKHELDHLNSQIFYKEANLMRDLVMTFQTIEYTL